MTVVDPTPAPGLQQQFGTQQRWSAVIALLIPVLAQNRIA
jgi:hypothetical protein